jgi:hypothetical protein
MFSSNSPPLKPYLTGPVVPTFIPNPIQREGERSQIERSNLNQWNPFPFSLSPIIFSADPAKKSPISTTEDIHLFLKTTPGAEPLFF